MMPIRMGRSQCKVSLGVLLGLMISTSSAEAGNDLNLERWLGKAGVQMLAVEFYATWCEPCMKAVPKWKKLHDKYRRKGLRLVVVAVRDPKGGCSSPGWSPDDVICDDEGTLMERFGAQSLPAAFLWNWRGEIYVDSTDGLVAHLREKSIDTDDFKPRSENTSYPL